MQNFLIKPRVEFIFPNFASKKRCCFFVYFTISQSAFTIKFWRGVFILVSNNIHLLILWKMIILQSFFLTVANIMAEFKEYSKKFIQNFTKINKKIRILEIYASRKDCTIFPILQQYVYQIGDITKHDIKLVISNWWYHKSMLFNWWYRNKMILQPETWKAYCWILKYVKFIDFIS